MCWMSALISLVLVTRGHRRAAVGPLVAPVLAVLAYLGSKRFLPRMRPPSAAAFAERTGSLPSAHSTTAAAVCCTLAYVLWREQILTGPPALALGIVPPLLIGVSRVYLDVHWATDVLAGWAVGIFIAAVARIAYNRATPSST